MIIVFDKIFRLLAITTDTSLMANDFISHSSPPQLSSLILTLILIF